MAMRDLEPQEIPRHGEHDLINVRQLTAMLSYMSESPFNGHHLFL